MATKSIEPTAAFPAIGIICTLTWSLIVAAWFLKISQIPFALIFDQWQLSAVSIIPNPEATFRHLKHLAALAGITAALLAIGHRLVRAAGIVFNNTYEELAISFGLGYGISGTLLFLMGLAGLWSRNILTALLGGSLLLGAIESRKFYQRARLPPGDPSRSKTPLSLFFIAGFFVIWLSVLRYTLIPETFYDALQYHLGLPNLFLLNGRIFPTPENSYSGIPALPQMVYGWTLALDSWGITAYLLHHSMVIWVGIGMVGYCQRIGRHLAGPLAAAVFFIVPVVLVESFSISVGMEWALMELCWFTSLYITLAHEPGTPDRTKWLILNGIFLGFAMGTKYQAWLLPIALIPLPFLKFSSPDSAGRTNRLNGITVKEVFWISVIAALCLSPWIGKNIWFYKNPLYPFFHEFFAGSTEYLPNWRAMSAAGRNIHYVLFSFSGFLQYAAFPSRFLFSGDIFQSTGLFSICFAPLLFWTRLSDDDRLLAWICVVSWISLSLLTGITRYFIPHLALATLLISCIIDRIEPRWFRASLLGLASLFGALFCFLWINLAIDKTKLDVFLGKKDYSQYLSHPVVSYPSPPYEGIKYLNQNAPEESRVLLYGDSRSFYLHRRYKTTSDDQIPLLEVWADKSPTPESLKHRFETEGINYILINLSEMERRRLWTATSGPILLKLAGFWKRYIVRVYEVKIYPERWVAVFKVLTSAEASRPHPADPLFEGLLRRFSIPQTTQASPLSR